MLFKMKDLVYTIKTQKSNCRKQKQEGVQVVTQKIRQIKQKIIKQGQQGIHLLKVMHNSLSKAKMLNIKIKVSF